MGEKTVQVFIVSGGVGASGNQLANTALAQFPDAQVKVRTVGNVRRTEQIANVVQDAAVQGGIILHTMVNPELRADLMEQARNRKVVELDVMGPLLSYLAQELDQEPAAHPGLYRQLRRDYFDRVEAINFAMAHDDGKNPEEWSQAEIVLVGVSRVGKTPLSMYLSVLGWKVANVPLVPGLSPAPQLFELDPRRVIGLIAEPGQLISHREQRKRRMGLIGPGPYAEPEAVFEEIENSRRLFQQGGFSVIDVTDKAIETNAEEIISLITRRFSNHRTHSAVQ